MRPAKRTLALVFVLLALASVFDAAWSVLVDGRWWAVMTLPIGLLFWSWLVSGALRRART